MKQKFWSWVKLALKFCFSFAILFYMVYTDRLDLTVVSRGFSQVYYLFPCVLLVVGALVLSLYRWSLLLKAQELFFPFMEVIRYGMIGSFFNTTMPGAVSGDLIKAWYVISEGKAAKKAPVFASILLDRMLGVFTLILVSVSPLLFVGGEVWDHAEIRKLAYIVLFLAAGVVAFLGLTFFSNSPPFLKLRQRLDFLGKYSLGEVFLKAFDSWSSYGRSPGLLAQALCFSFLCHLFVVFVTILSAKALGDATMDGFQFFLLAPLGLLTTAIPIAPAGLGVGHVAFGALFAMAGSSHGAEIFTMLVTIQICTNLCGVFFYLRSRKVTIPAEV